jgi:hypothetical protein
VPEAPGQRCRACTAPASVDEVVRPRRRRAHRQCPDEPRPQFVTRLIVFDGNGHDGLPDLRYPMCKRSPRRDRGEERRRGDRPQHGRPVGRGHIEPSTHTRWLWRTRGVGVVSQRLGVGWRATCGRGRRRWRPRRRPRSHRAQVRPRADPLSAELRRDAPRRAASSPPRHLAQRDLADPAAGAARGAPSRPDYGGGRAGLAQGAGQARTTPHAVHVIAKRSSHYVMFTQPKLIVDQVRRVVRVARRSQKP